MTADRHLLASRYFVPPKQHFWEWGDDGQVITWKDGGTIAFRQEIVHVLRRLEPHGLPPFGAIVWVLAACAGWWRSNVVTSTKQIAAEMTSVQSSYLDHILPTILERLDAIHALPRELRSTPEAKASLVEMVFEGCQFRTSSVEVARLIESLEEGFSRNELLVPVESDQICIHYLREIRSLLEGLPKVSEQSLRLRTQTGLDEIVEPADLELPPSDRVRQLVTRLRDDEELSGMARLAQNLMAAVHLPRPIWASDDLPLGGVSDIANRGSLDRLLVSELAQDDLTLAVRVAMNEALYLRREAPPKSPPGRRAMLLDSGIRLWGVPRVFAASVALALAATADRKLEIVAYRPAGIDLLPVDLTTRDGLVAHLEALDAAPHPAAALEEFFTLIQKDDGPLDAVLVTHADVLADPEFRRALSELEHLPLFVATVSRQGTFSLIEVNHRGQKLVASASLALDDLFAEPARKGAATPLINHEIDPLLPLILAVNPFPLLLPHHVEPLQTCFTQRHGVLAFTKDGRMMQWNEPGYGAHQWASDVPIGKLQWFAVDANETVARAVFGSPQSMHLQLFSANLRVGHCATVPLEVGQKSLLAVCGHAAALFLIYPHQVDVHDTLRGERVETLKLPPGVIWKRDRFFRGPEGWYALSHNGMKAALDLVVGREWDSRLEFLTFFDRPGVDGPFAVTNEGNIFCAAKHSKRPGDADSSAALAVVQEFPHGLAPPLRIIAMGPDGSRVALGRQRLTSDKPAYVLLELNSGGVSTYHGDQWSLVAPDVHKHVHPVNVRSKFQGIDVDAEGELSLSGRRNKRFTIAFDPAVKGLILKEGPAATANSRPRTFKPVAGPPGTQFELRVATWDDGSRVFLDSRGMLHLKSSDRQLPEISLVLNAGPLAGWLSDGRLFGPAYFTGQHRTTPNDSDSVQGTPVHQVLDLIRQFGRRLK